MAQADAVVTLGVQGQDQVTQALRKVGAEVDRNTKQVQANSRAMNNMAKSGDAVNKQFRLIRGGAGQVGHQIQDMAVQFQSGTNAAIVLGQQGSQIASLFGPQGAVIGAIGAVGAAIYTYLSNTSLQAERDLKAMKEEMMKTAASADGFNDSLRGLAAIKVANDLKSLGEQAKELGKDYTDALDKLQRFEQFKKNETLFKRPDVKILAAFPYAIQRITEALYFNEEAMAEANETVDSYLIYQYQLQKEAKKTEQILRNIKEGNPNPFVTDENAEKFLEKLVEMKDTYGMAEIALLHYQKAKLQDANVSQAIIDQIDTEIKAYADRKAQIDQQTEADKKAKQSAQQKADAQDRFIEKMEQMRQKQVLSQAQIFELEAAEFDLNEEQKKTVQLITAKMRARDDEIAQAKKKAEEDKKLADAEKAERERQAKMKPKAQAIRQTVIDFLALEESFKTEEEMIIQAEQNKLNILKEMYKLRGEEDQRYADLKNKIHQEANQALVNSERSKQSEIAGMMSQQLNQLASYFDESTALGKAAYVANQAMAISNAIISAEEASAKALALYPQMPAYAAMIKGIGYASAGAIAGQTLASFEGGGITFSGVRSGGMDGKGGRMAVVHPNEKITDLEKGGGTGQPVNVQFTINAVDAKGIDQLLYERRGMITGIVQKAVNNVGRRIM